MKSKFFRKLITRAPMVIGLLLTMVLLIASQAQAVYAQTPVPIMLGTWVKGVTTAVSPVRFYSFKGSAGQYVSISMKRDNSSPRLDPYLDLKDPNGAIVASDDESGLNGNSLIDSYQLESTGAYMIKAHSYDDQTYGVYWIYVTLSQ